MQCHKRNINNTQKEPIISSSGFSSEFINLDLANSQEPLDIGSQNNLTRKLKFLRLSLFDLAHVNFKKRERYREYLKAVLELEIAVFNEISQSVNNKSCNQEAKLALLLETIACYLHNDWGDNAKDYLKEVLESFGLPLSLINLDLIFVEAIKV